MSLPPGTSTKVRLDRLANLFKIARELNEIVNKMSLFAFCKGRLALIDNSSSFHRLQIRLTKLDVHMGGFIIQL